MTTVLFEKQILPAFLSHLGEVTRSKYLITINDFMRFCGKSFECCDMSDARNYDKYLTSLERISDGSRAKLSRTTHASRISTLRSLSSFIEKGDFIAGYSNIFSHIVVFLPDNEISSDSLVLLEDLEVLFEAAADDTMALLIFSLVAKCGLSTSQICNLSVSDVCVDKDGVICGLQLRRDGFSHSIFLTQDVLSLLRKYLAGCSLRSNSPLFVNQRGDSLKERTLQRMLQRYLSSVSDKLCVTNFTLQQMRHSAITYMKMGGATDEDIANYLGIVRPSSISRYRRVSENELLTAVTYSVLSVNQ